MAQRTDPVLGHRHLEDSEMTVVLVAKTLGVGMMDEKPMARQPPALTRRRWMLISRRMQTKMKWKK